MLLFLALSRIWRSSYWRYLKKHGGLDDRLGQTELDLTDDGVHVDYRTMNILFRWNGITGVDEDRGYIYISAGPLQAVAVPMRAFANSSDASQFRDAVRGRMLANPQ